MQILNEQKKIALKHKRLLVASAVLIVLVAAALFSATVKEEYLFLTNKQSGQVLFYAPAASGSFFAVSFIHSVNKSPVTEYYRIEKGQIYLDSLHYYTFGAGMPSQVEAGQTLSYADDGAMIIADFNRPMPNLTYNIGRMPAGQILHWQGREIPLNTLDAPGQPVLFSAVAYPRLWLALRIYPKLAR